LEQTAQPALVRKALDRDAVLKGLFEMIQLLGIEDGAKEQFQSPRLVKKGGGEA
jgi:hypothetical protein